MKLNLILKQSLFLILTVEGDGVFVRMKGDIYPSLIPLLSIFLSPDWLMECNLDNVYINLVSDIY